MSRISLFVALLLTASAFAQPAKLPPDLALVPQDGMAFVHIRVAELWGHESLKDVRTILKKAGDEAIATLDKRFAELPSNVERITLWLGPTKSKHEFDGDALFVIRLLRPADPKVIRTLLLPEGTEKKGKRFTWSSDAMGAALLIADDRTFVLGSRAEVAKIADGMPPTATPLADGIAMAAADRPLTAGVNLPAVPTDFRKEALEIVPESLHPALAARSATLALDLAGEGHLHLRVNYPTEAGATASAKLLKATDGPAHKFIGGLRSELEELVFDNKAIGLIEIPKAAAATIGLGVLKRAEELLASDRLRQNGQALEATIDLPKGSKTILVPAAFAAGAGVGAYATQWREMAWWKQSNDLKQMILALHNYHDTNGKAEAAVVDGDGKPLLSWRVHMLPYIEQDNLYKQFKLNEPWDSENNKKLIPMMPKMYEIAGHPAKPGETHYRTFVGAKAVWAFDRPFTLAQVVDGTSNTVVFVQAAEATIWTKPDELIADGKLAIKPRILFRDGRTLVGMCDGSVQVVSDKHAENIWAMLIDPADGLPIPEGVFKR
ncbi:MAG TPA: DUF1559 domain-containing protein [Gemmataceae bacterium]|jgi:hypothetical protein|nr:DUF1559 domain-containing protein [Gemmataceae bacterium]